MGADRAMTVKISAAPNRGYFILLDGHECFLRESESTFEIYRLCRSRNILLPAGLAAVLFGIFWSVWGGLLAGLIGWVGWYKFYLPSRAEKRLAEPAEPDFRIVRAQIASKAPAGARKLHFQISPNPAPPDPEPPRDQKIFEDWESPVPAGPEGSPPANPSSFQAELNNAAFVTVEPATKILTGRVTLEFLNRRDRERFVGIEH